MSDLPREPTPAMIEAAIEILNGIYGGADSEEVIKQIWEAMIEAREK